MQSGQRTEATLVIRGIGQGLTMSGEGSGAHAGERQGQIGLIEGAAVAAAGDAIVYAGPAGGLLERVKIAPEAVRIDAGGGVVLPGFVDCHTHLLFGGWREREFGMRVEGAGYREILNAGGGILETVGRTRALSEEELVEIGARRLRRMLRLGTTTVEAKSGYGLEMATEARLVRAARRLGQTEPADVMVTLLAAHAVPAERREERSRYLDEVEEMIDSLADRIDFVDAFCEEGAFSVAECRRVFRAAASAGVPVKLHADQLGDTGGAALAAEVGAVSADHLDWISREGIEAMAEAGTVAVLLPSVPLYVMASRQAPAGRIVDGGVPIALATDFNPGTSPVESIGLVVALGCMLLRLTPEQALVAATRNAAAALGLQDRVGALEEGKLADLQIYDVADYRMLPYRFGQIRPRIVIKRGRVVVDAGGDPG